MSEDVKTGGNEQVLKTDPGVTKTGAPAPKLAEVSREPKSDYIPPPQRRLGPHSNDLNEPFSCVNAADPVNFQLRKLVGLLVATSKHKPGFSGEFLDEATQLAAQFMSGVVTSLHKLTEVQRHLRPGLADLEMCLLDHGIGTTDIHSEYLRTKNAASTTKTTLARVARDLDVLLREYNASNYTLEKDDASLVFHANEQHEIANLVPRQATRRDYIPEYLPDLPPDFTFTLTGHYMPTTTDLKQIKLRLAEETRLNESSLYRLIDDDERRWRQLLERDLELFERSDDESVVEEVMSPGIGDKSVTDVETPDPAEATVVSAEKPRSVEPSLKRFDFVEYARKRRAARARYALEMAKRRKLRHNDVFMRAETVFSPYASAPPLNADREFFANVLDASFKKVIKATRVAEHEKKLRLARFAEERKKREAEQAEQSGAFEFGFAFNPGANHLDDSDDSDDEADGGASHVRGASPKFEFDFGDTAEPDLILGPGSDEQQDAVSEDTPFQRPHQAQVSGKAPLKAPLKASLLEYGGEILAQDQGPSDLEDELEHDFELEDKDEDKDVDEDEDEEEKQDKGRVEEQDKEQEATNATIAVSENLHGEGTSSHHETPQTNEPATHVLWGNLGSEESEEDELEDIE